MRLVYIYIYKYFIYISERTPGLCSVCCCDSFFAVEMSLSSCVIVSVINDKKCCPHSWLCLEIQRQELWTVFQRNCGPSRRMD